MKNDKNKLFAWFMLGLSLAGFVFFAWLAVLTLSSDFKIHSDSVAIIPIDGVIYDARDTLVALDKYFNDPNVKAVVLRINTPGGLVVPSQAIYSMVMELKLEHGKPVVAAFSDLGASGGYYIACAADEIFAYPSTITGSIGVIAEYYNIEELANKVGVSVEIMKSGEYKAAGNWMKTMTDKEREYLKGVMDDTYDQFLEAVVENRSDVIVSKSMVESGSEEPAVESEPELTPEEIESIVKNLADGRVFTGRQALKNGLIDSIGDIRKAIDRAAELANISEPSIVVARTAGKTGLIDKLTNMVETSPFSSSNHKFSLKYIISY